MTILEDIDEFIRHTRMQYPLPDKFYIDEAEHKKLVREVYSPSTHTYIDEYTPVYDMPDTGDHPRGLVGEYHGVKIVKKGF